MPSTCFQRAGAEVDGVYDAERCTHVISDEAASELPGGCDEVVQVRALFRLVKKGAHWEGGASSELALYQSFRAHQSGAPRPFSSPKLTGLCRDPSMSLLLLLFFSSLKPRVE